MKRTILVFPSQIEKPKNHYLIGKKITRSNTHQMLPN